MNIFHRSLYLFIHYFYNRVDFVDLYDRWEGEVRTPFLLCLGSKDNGSCEKYYFSFSFSGLDH